LATSATDFTNLGTITSLERRGKYIIIQTSQELAIIVHLRMTGKLIIQEGLGHSNDDLYHSCDSHGRSSDGRCHSPDPLCHSHENGNPPCTPATKPNPTFPKHTRAYFEFADNSCLLFIDIRTFGKIQILSQAQLPEYFQKLGPEPFSSDFNPGYFLGKARTRNMPIKSLLLDQSFVAGLGNIYVCEALFRTRINPCLPAKQLTKKQITNLINEIRQILTEAIQANGTSISDYRRVDDKTGEFQNFLRVYQKTSCPCGKPVAKIKQAGRSTYYCPTCQK